MSDRKTLWHRERLLISVVLALFALFLLGVIATRPAAVPDFAEAQDVRNKKAAFFSFLRQRVRVANQRVLRDRRYAEGLLDRLAQRDDLGFSDDLVLTALSARYLDDAERSLPRADRLPLILRRADVVPEPLALIQAAKESGWGSSRFAREGYNFFGQRCFDRGCGIVPSGRSEDGSEDGFEVARFASAQAGVDAYLLNLNTHPRYSAFREVRAEMRGSGAPLDSLRLVETLTAYSERGDHYVRELRSMLRAARL